MPFIQRVVQPVNIAQVNKRGNSSYGSGTGKFKFHCAPGKCNNNNCINKIRTEKNADDEESGNACARECAREPRAASASRIPTTITTTTLATTINRHTNVKCGKTSIK